MGVSTTQKNSKKKNIKSNGNSVYNVFIVIIAYSID